MEVLLNVIFFVLVVISFVLGSLVIAGWLPRDPAYVESNVLRRIEQRFFDARER